jgi:hypothetical protein
MRRAREVADGSPPATGGLPNLIAQVRAERPAGSRLSSRAMPPEAPDAVANEQRRADRSPWNWLLAVPIVVPLLTFLYDGIEPRLFGFPRFYWVQLAFIGLGVACTLVVHRMTKKAAPPAASAGASGGERDEADRGRQ